MSSTNNRSRLFRVVVPATCLLLLGIPGVSAQDDDLDLHVSRIKEQFQQLDARAQACLDEGAARCEDFLTSLNTTLPQYLQYCAVLRQWREQVVTNNADSNTAADAELAQRLIDVEYTCGEDALINRTESVLAAYEKSRNIPIGGLPTLIAESNNSQTRLEYGRSQSSTRQQVNLQQQRLRNEIQQQWQRIELQNVREQIRRPPN